MITVQKETKKKMKKIADAEMSHNPFFVAAVENIIENNDERQLGQLAQVYEQHQRNKMAYLTAKNREITNKELDKVFDKK